MKTVLILIAILVGIVVWITFMTKIQANLEERQKNCEFYRDYQARRIPARCLKYFINPL